MKKMKIFLAGLVSFALVFGFAACSSDDGGSDDPKENPPPVVNPPATDGEITLSVNKTNSENGALSATIDGGTINITLDGSSNWGEWSHQIFIDSNLSAEKDAFYDFSMKVNSPAAGSMVVKLNEEPIVAESTESLVEGENTIKFSFKSGGSTENIVLVFAPLAGATGDMTISNISLAKVDLNAINVESVVLNVKKTTVPVGEKQEYSVTINELYETTDAEFTVTPTEGATIEGNTITFTKADVYTVKATFREVESDGVTITVSATKNYNEYWAPGVTTARDSAPKDYFSIWADQNWCGSMVALSDMNATENSAVLTQVVTGNTWFGTQIWYGLSEQSNVTFKVKSSVAGQITINDTVYNVAENTVLPVSLEEVNGLIAVQLGRNEVKEGEEVTTTSSLLGSCTFEITDLVITPAPSGE